MINSCLRISFLFIIAIGLFGCGGESKKTKTMERPPFAKALVPADSGKVKPVDKKPSKPLKIAVLGLENNPFWIPVKAGTMKAAEELKPYGVQVDWIVPPGDSHDGKAFGKAIETAVVQQYDAVATIAGDSGIVPYIKRAVKKGVAVATFNSETDVENPRLFFVGADSYRQGEKAGKEAVRILGGKGKIGVITGFFSVEALELRRKGFLDYISKHAPDIKIVGEVENKDKGDIAYTQAKDFMSSHPDLAMIYVTAGGPFSVAAAVEKAGKAGKVKIICYDFVAETMVYVKKGVISGTIGQEPFAQGHDPAIRLFNYIVGGIVPEAGQMLTRADFVTKDNMDQFYKPTK